MPKRVAPTSFTAGRKIKIGGTTYAVGATIPNATVKALRRLSSLLSRRTIIPNVDPYNRSTALNSPTPTEIPIKHRRAL